MPPTKRPPQNQRQRPFKVPRRQTSPDAGPSKSAPESSTAAAATAKSKPTSKAKPKTTTKPLKTATASSSKSKPAASSRKNKSRAHSESPAQDDDDAAAAAAAAAAADTDSGSDASSVPSDRSRSQSREPSASGEPDFILAEITNANADETHDVTLSEPEIPPKLLTRLLHTHFQNPKTKIAKDANAVVAKYVDVFVREALARAAFERAEANGEGASFADGFLEVEDLEKMAPQLVLDF